MNTEKAHSSNGVHDADFETTKALIAKTPGELVETQIRTPSEIVKSAVEAARVLEDIIKQNKIKPVEFNGKRHLEIGHWQTIAKFFFCTPGTEDAEPVEIHGVKGFKAKAYVIDERTKERVGSAEAYCMMDEPKWNTRAKYEFNKNTNKREYVGQEKVPLFQLASMAQTRAASKALSNKFKYVAILAGYDPTPAEEMDEDTAAAATEPKREPIIMPESIAAAVKDRPLSLDERSKIISQVKAAGLIEQFKKFMAESLKAEHSSKLLLSHIPSIEAWLNLNANDI